MSGSASRPFLSALFQDHAVRTATAGRADALLILAWTGLATPAAWLVYRIDKAGELQNQILYQVRAEKNLILESNDAEIAKLKAYIEGGGMLVGNADCGNPKFANSFKKLGIAITSNEFRELPADHVMYTEAFPRNGEPPHAH